jgi:hypothetical protein
MANFHIAVIREEITRRKHGVLMKSSMTIYSKKLEEIHAIILHDHLFWCVLSGLVWCSHFWAMIGYAVLLYMV